MAAAIGITVLTAACVPQASGGGQQNAAASLNDGISLLAQRRYSDALVVFNKLSPWKSGNAEVLMGLAIASDMNGDFRTSDRAYEKLLVLIPSQAALYNNMGYSYMLRGDLERASSYLAEAARRDPQNLTIKNNIKMLRGVMPLQ